MTREAEIRRMAKKAGLPRFGERHVKAGTSTDAFFRLLTERLTSSPAERRAAKDNAGLSAGRREAKRLLGRSKRDDDADKGKDNDDTDGEEERDEDEADDADGKVCPTCGSVVDADDLRDDDDEDTDSDPDDKKDDEDDDQDGKRGLGGRGHRVRHAPGSARIDQRDVDRGAAMARKALGKR